LGLGAGGISAGAKGGGRIEKAAELTLTPRFSKLPKGELVLLLLKYELCMTSGSCRTKNNQFNYELATITWYYVIFILFTKRMFTTE